MLRALTTATNETYEHFGGDTYDDHRPIGPITVGTAWEWWYKSIDPLSRHHRQQCVDAAHQCNPAPAHQCQPDLYDRLIFRSILPGARLDMFVKSLPSARPANRLWRALPHNTPADSTPTDANQLRGTLRYLGVFGFNTHVLDLQHRVPTRRPHGRNNSTSWFPSRAVAKRFLQSSDLLILLNYPPHCSPREAKKAWCPPLRSSFPPRTGSASQHLPVWPRH